MDKHECLKKNFPAVESFRDVQEPAIDALIAGEKVLCLMPTGGGKSLIYQVAGLCLGKSTLIISPLVALMSQQCGQLDALGLQAVSFSGMDYRKQFQTISSMAKNGLPDFIFSSPERVSNDGHLEYVLNLRREDIGLIVIDEVHCISQWGDDFRPAYRNIPLFLERIFGDDIPAILCLTATLNDQQQQQVQDAFAITRVIKGQKLWRENLHLNIINLKSGPDETKDAELERIIDAHPGEKILVFVHRKKGKRATTRTLYEKYKDSYEGTAFFDSDLSDSEKRIVMQGFTDGTIKIVFATSAFGMGIDIPDIRVVVNYLISETVEQYYQEVGRAGRDGKDAYGYLLYTQQSKRGRRMLLNSTLCTEANLRNEWEDRKLKPGQPYDHISYNVALSDEQRIAFSLLTDYKVLTIVAKGVQSISCFEGVTQTGKVFLEDLLQYSRIGLVKNIAKRAGRDINSLCLDIWEKCASGDLKVIKEPNKAIFYTAVDNLSDTVVQQIMDDQQKKKEARVRAFEAFSSAIEAGESAEEIVKSALNL